MNCHYLPILWKIGRLVLNVSYLYIQGYSKIKKNEDEV